VLADDQRGAIKKIKIGLTKNISVVDNAKSEEDSHGE